MREDLDDLRRQTADGFTELRGGLDATAAGHEQIIDLLNTLIDRDGGRAGDR